MDGNGNTLKISDHNHIVSHQRWSRSARLRLFLHHCRLSACDLWCHDLLSCSLDSTGHRHFVCVLFVFCFSDSVSWMSVRPTLRWKVFRVFSVRPSDPSVNSESPVCVFSWFFRDWRKVSGANRDDFTSAVLCNEFELTVLEGGTPLPKQHCCSLARSLAHSLARCLTDAGKTEQYERCDKNKKLENVYFCIKVDYFGLNAGRCFF